MKSIPLSIIIAILMISISLNAVQEVQADITIIIDDPVDDVYVTTNTSYQNAIYSPAINPDVDIIQVDYYRESNSKNVTMSLTLNEKGEFVNRNELDSLFRPSNEGRSAAYVMQLVTNEHFYLIVYLNNTCKLFNEEINYTLTQHTLTVSFQIDSVYEQYDYIIGSAYEGINSSQDGYHLYIDGAPNDKLISFNINDNNHEWYIDEEYYFEANIYDIFGIAEPPFTFDWDLGDGTEIEQSNITTSSSRINHTYTLPGTYHVKLYFHDAAGHYAYNELLVDVNIRPPDYELYIVNWTKISKEIHINRFVSRKTPSEDSISLDVSKRDILSNAEIQIEWNDDNTYGFLIDKGLDTLTITLCNQTDCLVKKSIGQGTLNYQFDLFDRPHNFTVVADNVFDAHQLIDPLVSGRNHEQYNIKAEIETGEKFWRLLKFVSDAGNDIEITVTYDYYQNSITLIDE